MSHDDVAANVARYSAASLRADDACGSSALTWKWADGLARSEASARMLLNGLVVNPMSYSMT